MLQESCEIGHGNGDLAALAEDEENPLFEDEEGAAAGSCEDWDLLTDFSHVHRRGQSER